MSRECNCPEWVVLCSHFDGGIAYVCDRLALPSAVFDQWIRAEDKRYLVYPSRFETDDQDAAREAFHEAALSLLAQGGAL